MLGSLNPLDPVAKKWVYLWGEYEIKVGISQTDSYGPLGRYSMRDGESPFVGSMEELWMYRYTLYKVAESFSVTFREWMKQPIYALERNIDMIRRTSEEVAAAMEAAPGDG